MAGYVIHIAVGLEYLRKHSVNLDAKEFIEGVIYPDSVKDKSLTHYGIVSSKPDLAMFLMEHPLVTSFDYGYFEHLLTDYLFYNHYIDTFSKNIYHDYDLLNKDLMNRYHVELPEKVKDKVFFSDEGDLTILNYDLICRMIDEISDLDLDKTAEDILTNLDQWRTFRELKRI